MVDKQTVIKLLPGQILDVSAATSIKLGYPSGRTNLKRIILTDRGTWVEPPVEPPPVEPPPPPPPSALRTFYLSPTGSDTATGGVLAPWRSLQKFYSQCRAGDLLLVRGGVYSSPPPADTLGKASGTGTDPITVKAHPGEKPDFVSQALYIDGGVGHHVVDGLTFSGRTAGSSTAIWVGNGKSAQGSTKTHHITLRNLTVNKGAGSVVTHHGIYLSWMVTDVLIEDLVSSGQVATDDRAAAIHVYHAPTATNITVRRALLKDWGRGIILWDEGSPPISTGLYEHITFLRNNRHFDARYHDKITVRSCVGSTGNEAGTIGDLYDPFHSALTTKSHNYWDQPLNADGSLQAGSPAIGGAHDGSDAGAVPYAG